MSRVIEIYETLGLREFSTEFKIKVKIFVCAAYFKKKKKKITAAISFGSEK